VERQYLAWMGFEGLKVVEIEVVNLWAAPLATC
jgi:hypothetical protein